MNYCLRLPNTARTHFLHVVIEPEPQAVTARIIGTRFKVAGFAVCNWGGVRLHSPKRDLSGHAVYIEAGLFKKADTEYYADYADVTMLFELEPDCTGEHMSPWRKYGVRGMSFVNNDGDVLRVLPLSLRRQEHNYLNMDSQLSDTLRLVLNNAAADDTGDYI